jgi:crotonobetainyl-CoA:carnitine CoA-transferase CaiB-like acyl-CoA transferase
MATLPLAGTRVIDLSHAWAAPHATRLLADYGAEVIKIEYLRRLCILRGARRDDAMYDHQPGWTQVNRNKLSATFDLEREDDRDALRQLIRSSDVLVENSRPGVLEALDLDPRGLTELNPGLVVLSMPAFGHHGPWAAFAGYGAIFEALGGIQSLTAYDETSPPSRIKEIDTLNGVVGACAILTALLHRRRTGAGQHIDLSQLEAAMHTTAGPHLLEQTATGGHPPPHGNRHSRYAPQGCYRCRGDDAWITLTIRSDEEWGRLCRLAGHPEWETDERFATADSRRRHHDVLDDLIGDWTCGHDHNELMHMLQRANIAAGAVLALRELPTDPHLRARGYFTEVTPAASGRFMGAPIRLGGEQPVVRTAGPRVGEHNQYVHGELIGRAAADVPTVRPDEIGLAYDPE